HIRKGETYESAARRSFDIELRIKEPVRLEHLFDFTYQEELGNRKENEFCKVFLGRHDGKFEPNPSEIDQIELLTFQELKNFVLENEEKTTKWLRETVKRMKG